MEEEKGRMEADEERWDKNRGPLRGQNYFSMFTCSQ